jgi:serine/threonine protein kinase
VYRCEGTDKRSDIYSFGLVLWQMAAGSRVPPFMVPWRNDMENFLRAIHEQQMTSRIPSVKGPFGPLIERCLQPAPSERYASFQELRDALESSWEASSRFRWLKKKRLAFGITREPHSRH